VVPGHQEHLSERRKVGQPVTDWLVQARLQEPAVHDAIQEGVEVSLAEVLEVLNKLPFRLASPGMPHLSGAFVDHQLALDFSLLFLLWAWHTSCGGGEGARSRLRSRRGSHSPGRHAS